MISSILVIIFIIYRTLPVSGFLWTHTFAEKAGDSESADEDLAFGGYMPSTMSSRPSSKRSVRQVDGFLLTSARLLSGNNG